MISQDRQLASRWPHRLSVMLVAITFPLIWVGGLVTSYDAGMAVPDWPSTYGHNLFAYPWTTWIFGPWDLFIEHGHRLLGALAGIVTIGLVISVFAHDPRRWVQWFSLATLGMVILQGVLGGVRVLLDARQVAMLHGVTGPVFFSMATAMAVFTSQLWQDRPTIASDLPMSQPRKPEQWTAAGGPLHRLGLLTVLLAYVQLVVGAQLRHVPVDASPQRFNVALMFHLILAFALVVHVSLLAWKVFRLPSAPGALYRPAAGLAGLILLQIGLGVATWVFKYSWPGWMSAFQFAAAHVNQASSLAQAMTVTAHVATGSLILVTSLVVFLRSWRLVPSASRAGATRVLSIGWIA